MKRAQSLAIDRLEDRQTPSSSIMAIDYDPSRVGFGDIDGDGVSDVVNVSKAGQITQLTVQYGGTDKTETISDIFEPTYLGGAKVAVGDLDGDGKAEVIVSADVGGSGRIVVLSYTQNPTIAIFPPPPPTFGLNVIASFYGIEDKNFRGGSSVAASDFNGDGKADLVVGAGFGGGPRVAIYDGTTVATANPTRLINDFFAIPDLAFRGGVSIDAGDVDGDGRPDLIVGPGFGGGQRTRVLSGMDIMANQGHTAEPLADFFLGGSDNGNRLGVIVDYLPPYNDNTFGGFTVFPYSAEFVQNKLVIAGGVSFVGKDLPRSPGSVPPLDERMYVQ